MRTFILPDLGEGLHEAEIVAWHVRVGDVVKEVICHQTELITYLEGYIRGNSVNAY